MEAKYLRDLRRQAIRQGKDAVMIIEFLPDNLRATIIIEGT